jgi:CheY-like chemotaxis protein
MGSGTKIWTGGKMDQADGFNPAMSSKEMIEKEEIFKVSLDKEPIIIIAEDEEINFLLLKAMLRSINCRIIHAYNGAEVLENFKNNSEISLVLMDIKMPVMDGITAAMKMRKINADVPIIAQTAYQISKEHLSLFQGYISKPIDKTDLINLVTQYVK